MNKCLLHMWIQKNTSKITFTVNTYAYVLSSTSFCNVYFKHTKRLSGNLVFYLFILNCTLFIQWCDENNNTNNIVPSSLYNIYLYNGFTTLATGFINDCSAVARCGSGTLCLGFPKPDSICKTGFSVLRKAKTGFRFRFRSWKSRNCVHCKSARRGVEVKDGADPRTVCSAGNVQVATDDRGVSC